MPSFHPPPKQSLDAWDEDFGDTTLQLSDLVAAAASTNLDECLLAREDGGAQWTGTGQLKGNFFHEPVLNERRADVDGTMKRASSPVAEGKGKGRARDLDELEGREGKRSRTSTRERQSTNTSDQLPTPSPEPSASLQPPKHASEPSRRSREPSSSSSNRHSSSSRTINNQPFASSSSSRQPPSPPIVVEEEIDTAATSDVLRWRSQMDAEPVSGLEAERGDREVQAKEGRRPEESSTSDRDPSSSRSRTTTTSSSDHLYISKPSSATSSASRSQNYPSSSSSRTTTTHAALPLSFDLSHRPAPPTRQPHNSFSHSTVVTNSLMKSTSSNSLNRSTSSSSSTTSYSHLARQPAKDDFYERRKRDSYVGPVGLTDLADSPPASPPRAVKPRVEKKREGATMAGRVEKPSRRHKSPISPKTLPLAALSSLIPSSSLPSSTTNAEASSSSTVALPSTPVSSVRDFFTRYIMGAQQAKKPAASVAPSEPVEVESEHAEDHVPGSFTKAAEPSTSSLPTPPTSIIHPPTPPRPRPTAHAPKPSAFPPSSRPHSSSATVVRRPLQQTAIRSSNLPPVVPLGPPIAIPSKDKGKSTRTVSNPSKPPSSRTNPPLASSTTSRRLSISSSLSTSTTTTLPKPFNLHTTVSRPVLLPQPTPLPHEPGFIPSFSHSHALEAKRAAQRLARTEALKVAKLLEEAEQKEREGQRGGLFGGLERRMVERGRWEEEQRLKEVRMEVVRRREEGERMERERLKIIEERKATVIKANPVPAMYRRN